MHGFGEAFLFHFSAPLLDQIMAQSFYARPLDAVGFATLAAATYSPGDPVIPPNPVIGSIAFVDLLLLGGAVDDEVQALFAPPDPVIPPNPIIPPNPVIPPNPIRLVFFDGAAWSPVFSSDGAPPLYASASGFSVDFTATSTPQLRRSTARCSRS